MPSPSQATTLLIICWGLIFEIGLRLQQYFGPLYDLEMASFNLKSLTTDRFLKVGGSPGETSTAIWMVSRSSTLMTVMASE
jgi:hypothetical protein